MTLIELLIVVVLVGLLTAGVLTAVGNKIHKARLARCFAELRSVQSTIFQASYDSNQLPDPCTFWDEAWNGQKLGSYFYLVDGDANQGHGNDLDGFDEDNPGNSDRPEDDIEFVIVCQHNHADLADYVYLEDGGPPTIVLGSDDPGYDKFIGKDQCD